MKKVERENWQIEMFSLVKKWQKGETSQKDFCIRHDIPLHVFYYWLKKHKQVRSSFDNGFVPVEISSVEDKRKEMGDLQIHYPNGVLLTLNEAASISRIKALIKAF
jgi:hypothetical protein